MKSMVLRRGLALLLAPFFLSGCGAKLRPDPMISAVDAGAPTAEIWVNGAPSRGLSIVGIKEGESLDSLDLQVQTYYNGQVRIDSKECEIARTIRYSNSQKIKINLLGEAKSCVISVVVSPEYPNQLRTSIKVYPFVAHVYIRATKQGDDWIGQTALVSGSFSKPIRFFVGGESARAVFSGCNNRVEKEIRLIGGWADLDLNEIANPDTKETCVSEGVFISPEYKDLLVSVLVAKHSTEFSGLAEPLVELVNGSISVVADPSASIISLDGLFVISNKAKFQFDQTKTHVLRVLTVKGRSILGVFKPGEGWSWL